jgi:hypothetical protein
MLHIFKMLKDRFSSRRQQATFQAERPEEIQVIVPEAVVLPLPKTPRDEISVPASINGRDLSTGRL